jgi:hypothetical protein
VGCAARPSDSAFLAELKPSLRQRYLANPNSIIARNALQSLKEICRQQQERNLDWK